MGWEGVGEGEREEREGEAKGKGGPYYMSRITFQYVPPPLATSSDGAMFGCYTACTKNPSLI